MINRGKTSRQQLKERCATLKRYMFYPEGTRRAGHADAELVRRPGASARPIVPAVRADAARQQRWHQQLKQLEQQ